MDDTLCSWSGSLSELVTFHYLECTKVNDPSFQIKYENKLLSYEIVALRQEKDALLVQCEEMKACVSDIRREYDAYKQTVESKNEQMVGQYEKMEIGANALFDANMQRAIEQNDKLKQ